MNDSKIMGNALIKGLQKNLHKHQRWVAIAMEALNNLEEDELDNGMIVMSMPKKEYDEFIARIEEND